MPVRDRPSITSLVGGTPLLALDRLTADIDARVLVKLESFNPCSSVKDRVARAMIDAAIEAGQITDKTTVVEPTSGNTGIALAFVCAARGIPLTLTMPENQSIERQNLLQAFGANLVLTSGYEGMPGAISRAEQLCRENANHYMLQQFSNPANPKVHYETTGPEIWSDSDGEVDVFVAGVGTGGTVSGVGRYLKEQKTSVSIVALEPAASPVLSGGRPGPHTIQGIGAGFVPDNLERRFVDEIVTVSDHEAAHAARRLAREEGILAGISAGANVAAALSLAKRPEYERKTIVTLICDSGERYLSTDLFRA